MAIKSNNNSVPPKRTTFKLPSRALPYRALFPNFPEEVQIGPYSYATEEILTDSDEPVSTKLARIAKIVAVNLPQQFDTAHLVGGDLWTIIAIARALTYGESYDFQVTCPSCGHKEGVSIKVPDELPIVCWEDESAEAMEARLAVKLPHCKDVIQIRYTTIADDLEMERLVKLNTNVGGGRASRELWSAASHIVAVNGGAPDQLVEAVQYLRGIEGEDMVALNEFIAENGCGPKFEWDVVCDKCGHQYNHFIPLNRDFFRRSSFRRAPSERKNPEAAF